MEKETITLRDYRNVLESMRSLPQVNAVKLYSIFPQYTARALNGIVGRLVTGGYLNSRQKDGTTFYRISGRKDLPTLEKFLGDDSSEIIED